MDFLVSRSNVSLIGDMSVAQRNMKQNHLKRLRAGRTACPQTRCRGLTERRVLESPLLAAGTQKKLLRADFLSTKGTGFTELAIVSVL